MEWLKLSLPSHLLVLLECLSAGKHVIQTLLPCLHSASLIDLLNSVNKDVKNGYTSLKLKTDRLRRSWPIFCPIKVSPVAPTIHNCCFDKGPTSPRYHWFQQKDQTDQTDKNTMFADILANISNTFVDWVWAPFPHLLVLLKGLAAETETKAKYQPQSLKFLDCVLPWHLQIFHYHHPIRSYVK